MDKILQMLQSFLPPGFQEVSELQQIICAHKKKQQDNHNNQWQIEMLEAIRPRLPEHNRHMADILIKCLELAALLEHRSLEKGRVTCGPGETL